MRSESEFSQKAKVWRVVIGWLIWASIIAISANSLIHRANTVVPTAHGMEFFEIGKDYLYLGVLILFSTSFTAVLSPSRRLLWWLLSFVLSGVAGNLVHDRLEEIQFVRTPPCWGIHSSDPGSGESCPTGMRKDFTVAQLRQYYRDRQ